MKKKYGKKTLVEEKERFSVDTKNVILYLIGLYVLVVVLVSLVLYNPSVSSDTSNSESPVSESDYSSTEDDIVVDQFGENCSKDVLNTMIDESKKIKFNYSITTYDTGELAYSQDPDEDPVPYYEYGYELVFSNIGKHIYLNITNNVNSDTYDINKDGSSSKYSFVFKDILEMATFDVKVYSNDSSCNSELIREYTLALPRFNTLSLAGYCHDSDDTNCEQLTYEEDSQYVMSGYVDEETGEVIAADDSSDGTDDETGSFKLPEFSVVNVLLISSIIYCLLVLIIFTIFKILNKKKVGDI